MCLMKNRYQKLRAYPYEREAAAALGILANHQLIGLYQKEAGHYSIYVRRSDWDAAVDLLSHVSHHFSTQKPPALTRRRSS